MTKTDENRALPQLRVFHDRYVIFVETEKEKWSAPQWAFTGRFSNASTRTLWRKSKGDRRVCSICTTVDNLNLKLNGLQLNDCQSS